MLQYTFPLWNILTVVHRLHQQPHLVFCVTVCRFTSTGTVYVSATFAGQLYIDLNTAESLEPEAG